MSAATRSTRSTGCVVWAAMPNRGPFLQAFDVLVAAHDVARVQILGQAAHFGVAWLSNDDRVAAVGDERGDGPVSGAHERARGVHDTKVPGS